MFRVSMATVILSLLIFCTIASICNGGWPSSLPVASAYFIDSTLLSELSHSLGLSLSLSDSSWHHHLWSWYSHWMEALSQDYQLHCGVQLRRSGQGWCSPWPLQQGIRMLFQPKSAIQETKRLGIASHNSKSMKGAFREIMIKAMPRWHASWRHRWECYV